MKETVVFHLEKRWATQKCKYEYTWQYIKQNSKNKLLRANIYFNF